MLLLQSPPHAALQKYIGQYIYISLNTAILPCLVQTFLPYDIPAISFFFESVSLERKNLSGVINTISSRPISSYYIGLITSPYTVHFLPNQDVKAFMIYFKASGFSAFFRRNISELTDQLPDFSLLAGPTEADLLLEQLAEAKDFAEQVKVSDAFFLKRMPSKHNNAEQINEACRRLILTDGLMNMKELAYHTNMSLRTLERHFMERVGVSPKLYARFKRFHHALSLMNRPHAPSWANIAYECGYYDQTHFIKEFKTFANQSPSVYSAQEYLLYNQMISFKNFLSY